MPDIEQTDKLEDCPLAHEEDEEDGKNARTVVLGVRLLHVHSRRSWRRFRMILQKMRQSPYLRK